MEVLAKWGTHITAERNLWFCETAANTYVQYVRKWAMLADSPMQTKPIAAETLFLEQKYSESQSHILDPDTDTASKWTLIAAPNPAASMYVRPCCSTLTD